MLARLEFFVFLPRKNLESMCAKIVALNDKYSVGECTEVENYLRTCA
jgi:hypothetical protein